MPGVRDAAAALIGVAPESTVLTVLRMLVDSLMPAPARSPEARLPPVPRRVLAPRRKPAMAAPIDENWEELRRQVKAAMTERSSDYADMAVAIGRSAVALKIDLSRRQPPRPTLQVKLRAWLEQAAPAVAAAPAPFLGSEHRGNGHDHPAAPTAVPTPEEVPLSTCVWEERRPGASQVRRCDAPAMPGRPWCPLHWRSHQIGKALQGRMAR